MKQNKIIHFLKLKNQNYQIKNQNNQIKNKIQQKIYY